MSKSNQSWVERVPVQIWIAIVVLALGLLGWQVSRFFGQEPRISEGIEMTDYIGKMARESEGNFDRLSPADQKKVDEMTGGDGRTTIKMMWDQMPKMPAGRSVDRQSGAAR